MFVYSIDGTENRTADSTVISVKKGQTIEIDLGSEACWLGHGFNHRLAENAVAAQQQH